MSNIYRNPVDISKMGPRCGYDFTDAIFENEITNSISQLPKKISFKNAIFKGSVKLLGFFKDAVDFEDAKFEKKVTIKGQFNDNVSFKNATFKGPIELSETRFGKDVDFEGGKFEDLVTFSTATFAGNANFTNTDFEKEVNFTNTKFMGEKTNFNRCKFLKNVDFSNTKINFEITFQYIYSQEGLTFNNTHFGSAVNFSHAKILGRASFFTAKFEEKADFSNSVLEGAYFKNAHFNDSANFELTNFSNFVSFENANFNKLAKFSHAKLSCDSIAELSLNFTECKFYGEVDFKSATFTGPVLFKKAHFELENKDVHFNNATFKGDGCVNFSKSHFRAIKKLDFSNVDFQNNGEVSFSDSYFGYIRQLAFIDTTFRNSSSLSFIRARFYSCTSIRFEKVKFINGRSVSFTNAHSEDVKSLSFSKCLFANKGTVNFNDAIFNCDRIYFNRTTWINTGSLYFLCEFNTKSSLRFSECLFLNRKGVLFGNIFSNIATVFPKDQSTIFQRCFFGGAHKIYFNTVRFNQTIFEGGKIEWLQGLSEKLQMTALNLSSLFKMYATTAPQWIKDDGDLITLRVPIYSHMFENNTEVYWKDLTSESAKNLTFRGVDLSTSVFDGVTLSHIQLNATTWQKEKDRYVLYAEKQLNNDIKKDSLKQSKKEHDARRNDLINQYTQLKNNLESKRDFVEAGRFHRSEHTLRREGLNWFSKHVSLNDLYRGSSRYGECPKTAFINTLLLIIMFTLASLALQYNPISPSDIPLKKIDYFADFIKTSISYLLPFWKTNINILEVEHEKLLQYCLIFVGKIAIYLQTTMLALAIRRRFKR